MDEVAQPCNENRAKSSESNAVEHIGLAQVPSNTHIMHVTRDIANESGVGSMTANLSRANIVGGLQRTQRHSCLEEVKPNVKQCIYMDNTKMPRIRNKLRVCCLFRSVSWRLGVSL